MVTETALQKAEANWRAASTEAHCLRIDLGEANRKVDTHKKVIRNSRIYMISLLVVSAIMMSFHFGLLEAMGVTGEALIFWKGMSGGAMGALFCAYVGMLYVLIDVRE